jgi:hypothetical protein
MELSLSRYLYIVLIVAAVLFGGRQGAEQIVKLGCLPPGGIKPADGWLQTCASDRVGGIDESVIWFGTEPSVSGAVAAAKVLIFGDSRIEYAISRGGGSEWFSGKGIPFYLLAFGGGAESGLARKLLDKFHPHPDLVIFNVDPYFTGGFTLTGQAIAANPERELKAVLETQSFMRDSAKYCTYIPWLCGRTSSGYRANIDGHLFNLLPERYWFGRAMAGHFPVDPPPPWDRSQFETYLQDARSVIALAGIDPKCVVFTLVPNSEQNDELARFLAERTGGTAIAPHFDGLFTSDRSHLTVDSAKIWTAAFLEKLTPVLQQCVQGPSASISK